MVNKINPSRTTVYDQEYFSGSQVNLYIGDVLIDEISGLEFAVHQEKGRVHGYNSQLFDAVTQGTVIVTGQFSINFKESGYLYTVLNRWKGINTGKSKPSYSPFYSTKNVGGAKSGGRGSLVRQNIEEVMQGNASPEQLVRYYQDLAGFSNLKARESAEARRNNTFNAVTQQGKLETAEDLFEAYEDEIWGKNPLTAAPRRVDDSAFDGFTIFITYGDYNTNDYVNHTARRIDRVSLTTTAQVVMNNGKPVEEVYRFFARNLV